MCLSCVDMWPRSRGNLCSEFRKSIHWLMSPFLRRVLLCFLLQHIIKLSMTAFNVFFAPLEHTKPILQPINTIKSACERLVFIVSSRKTPAIPQKMSKTRQNEKSFLLFIAIHHTYTHTQTWISGEKMWNQYKAQSEIIWRLLLLLLLINNKTEDVASLRNNNNAKIIPKYIDLFLSISGLLMLDVE